MICLLVWCYFFIQVTYVATFAHWLTASKFTKKCGISLVKTSKKISVFLVNLLENTALQCLVACYSHQPHLNFNFKYKIEGETVKLKTIIDSYTGLDLSIHDKKQP
jgi:hypothetical protein